MSLEECTVIRILRHLRHFFDAVVGIHTKRKRDRDHDQVPNYFKVFEECTVIMSEFSGTFGI